LLLTLTKLVKPVVEMHVLNITIVLKARLLKYLFYHQVTRR